MSGEWLGLSIEPEVSRPLLDTHHSILATG